MNRKKEEPTYFLLQRSLRLDVALLQFIVEFFECFEVFDGDSHFLDFLTIRKNC
jgi:hypothetical protein